MADGVIGVVGEATNIISHLGGKPLLAVPDHPNKLNTAGSRLPDVTRGLDTAASFLPFFLSYSKQACSNESPERNKNAVEESFHPYLEYHFALQCHFRPRFCQIAQDICRFRHQLASTPIVTLSAIFIRILCALFPLLFFRSRGCSSTNYIRPLPSSST